MWERVRICREGIGWAGGKKWKEFVIENEKAIEENEKARAENEKARVAADKMGQREFELKQLELTFRNTEEYRNIETHRRIIDQDLSIRNNMCRFHFQLYNQHESDIDTFLQKFEM